MNLWPDIRGKKASLQTKDLRIFRLKFKFYDIFIATEAVGKKKN